MQGKARRGFACEQLAGIAMASLMGASDADTATKRALKLSRKRQPTRLRWLALGLGSTGRSSWRVGSDTLSGFFFFSRSAIKTFCFVFTGPRLGLFLFSFLFLLLLFYYGPPRPDTIIPCVCIAGGNCYISETPSLAMKFAYFRCTKGKRRSKGQRGGSQQAGLFTCLKMTRTR